MEYSNIVLTGIMGCGKTTVGKIVSQKLNMQFIDTDHYIENKFGKISDLFKRGESQFREIEHSVVMEISELTGVVIATGGGVVKKEGNIAALKRNGLVIFVDRPLKNILSSIEISQRPLLANGKNKLVEIYNERYFLYKKNCDIHINNAENLEDTVSYIIDCWTRLQANKYP